MGPVRACTVLGLLLLASCGGGPGSGTGSSDGSPGERRALRDHWPAQGAREPVLRMEGEELYESGAWVKDGTFTFYDEQGREVASGRYALGLEEGPWHQVDDGGHLARGSYRAGRREGRWSYYYPDGSQVNAEGAYVEGARTGQWLRYYEDGTPAAELMYRDGQWHGECRFYARDGSVDSQRTGRYALGERVQ